MTVPHIALTDEVGPAGAPLVVLGSSIGTSSVLWEQVIPILADRYRVVAWDLPGHGRARPATEPFTIAELADAVAEAVSGSGPVFYAGVSLGGAVGLELLLRHPELVKAAAIVCSGAKIGQSETWHERADQVRAQSTSVRIIPSAQVWFAPGSIEREPELTGRLLHVLQDADDESYAACCDALAEFDVRDRLGEITAPVLAVWGEHDTATPEATAAEIANGVRDGRLERIAGAAHLPPAERAQETAELLLDFFGTRG
ncbi:alpha/beta fold hydrolase [Agromyces sp. H66]|uniref:alpha/beta fold hydrolase n=1 Tax=Agromyces sp. H66 TaxID=2529859 RepID=UPI0010AA3B83|nr:alpha/beta fold hydrolase [Agromyces sp. H66]